MNRKWLNLFAMLALFAGIVSACVSGPGFRSDVYLAPTGSDSNDCWSAAAACATADHALGRLSDSGVVHFAAGEYRLTGSINDLHGLTLVTFRGESSRTTTLYSPPGGGEILRFSTPALVEIYNLAFDGRDTPAGTTLGSRGILIETGAIVRIQASSFNGLSRGIENNGGSAYVHDSQFTQNKIGILNSNAGSAFTTIDGSQFNDNLYAIQHDLGRMEISGTAFTGNGVPPSDALRPETIQNGGRMSISDSTFQEDAYFAITNLKEGTLDLTNVYITGGQGTGIVNYGQLTSDYLTITGKPGGGFSNADNGSTLVDSNARLSHAVISDNGTFGIQNQHLLFLADSIVQGNSGDGIINENVDVDTRVSISHSAIVGNQGRGIYNRAGLDIENSTISGNELEGINFIGSGDYLVSLHFVTVAENAGGGVWSRAPSGTYVVVYNSIIALNPGGLGNCTGQAEWFFAGFDLACDVPASSAALGLGPLTNIGGTWVHPLLAGSPAIDSAFIRTGLACPATDQVGSARPQPVGGRCDVGAYESTFTGAAVVFVTPSGGVPGVVPLYTPTPTEAAAPIFVFNKAAYCRQGPNTLYKSIGEGQSGQQAQIEGISDPPGWYYVLLANGQTRCFVAGTVGDITGPVDGLPVIPTPPLPTLPPTPAAPNLNVSNSVCNAQSYVVHLSWKDVAGEDGYRVYRDGTLIATLGAGAGSYDDTSPDYGSHSYQVEAYNAAGAAGSSVMNSTGCVY